MQEAPWRYRKKSRTSTEQERLMTLDALFADRVSAEPNTGCWLWTGRIDASGYGCCNRNGERLAHRLTLALATGRPAGEMYVLHRCDQPACVNPAHLFLGTQSDNVRDCSAKGRIARGPKTTGGRRTHCPQGHPYSPDNTIRGRHGWRLCRACRNAYQRAQRLKRKESQSCTV